MQLFKFFHSENTSNFQTQTAKNGGFFEELLSENDFEAVLVNLCCYEYGANASEAVQKISTRILFRVYHSGGKHHYNFFRNPPPPPPNPAPPPRVLLFCYFGTLVSLLNVKSTRGGVILLTTLLK